MRVFEQFAAVAPVAPLSPVPVVARDVEGQAVTWVQQRLTDLGIDVGAVDGRFGERTAGGLAAFATTVDADASGSAAMSALLAAAVAPMAVADGWAWPLPGAPNAPITSPFCWRGGRHHAGIDIGAARGTAIGASRAGRVIYAGVAQGYGNLVVIGHGVIAGLGRVHSYYGHMLRIRVSNNQQVGTLHRVGDVDSTGSSTGDHLHFEIRKNCGEGQAFTGTPVNPCNFLARC